MSSGLFVSNTDEKDCGGVFSFFDEKKNSFSFLYPEITGYFVSTLKFLYHIEKDEKYLKYAKHSCDWLIGVYEKYGSIIQGIKSDSSTSDLSYSFDSAICAKGLLDYYEITGNNYYLDYSKKILTDLSKESIQPDGSLMPFKDITTNQYQENTDVWYKQKGCLHVKTSMPFFQINQYVNDNTFLEIGNSICSSISNFQNSDGSIRMHYDSKIINLHTLCYALEGLVYAYNVTKNNDYLQYSEKAIVWCLQQILDDGSILLWHNSKFKSKAAYPIAQLIRILILLDKINNNSKYRSSIDRLYNFLISLQATHTSQKIDGGFYEEFYKSLFGWKKRLRVNSWTSMFALQAIHWNQNYDKINFKEQVNFLY
jgi:uncharacterized protein YyaL (SSP411 family)